MTTSIAPDLKPDDSESEERSIPALVRDLAGTTREEPDAHSYDATQGRQIGSQPYDDATQGRQIGSDPYDDPTQGRQIGSDPYDDATQGRQIGSTPHDDATRAR